MKKAHLFLTIAGVFSLFPGLSSAIDRPDDSAMSQGSRTKAGSSPAGLDKLDPIPVRKADVWLGIVPGVVPEVVLAQLNRDGNPGVVVEGTAPDSPARKAGIMDMDIVLRVGDRSVYGPEDLKIAIENNKPGDKVDVVILRGGKQQTLNLELMEATPGTAKMKSGNVRGMIDRAIGAGATPLPLDDPLDVNDPFALLNELMSGMNKGMGFPDDDQIRQRMLRHLKQMPGGIPNGMGIPRGASQSHSMGMSQSSFRFFDGNGEVIILGNGNDTRVEVYDRNGKLLFEGPYSTDEDKNNVPPEIKARLSKFRVGR